MRSINNFGNFKPQQLRPLPLQKIEENIEDEKPKAPAPKPAPQTNTTPDGSRMLAEYIKSTIDTQNTVILSRGTTKKTGAASGNFDFSVVPGYNDDFSSFYTQIGIGSLGGATSKKTIDEGYWDKALDALDQLRPQLHEYIKAQLEAKGLEYNESTVDKFINYFISQSVEMALVEGGFPLEQTAENWEECGKSSSGVSFKMSTVVNALLQQIDAELGNESKYTAFGTPQTPHYAPDAFSETSWNKTSDLNHHKVQDTADKFLTSDEKMLKTVLVGLEIPDTNPFGQTTTSTKVTVQHVLKLYQDTVRGYLKQSYSDLTDEQIENIISKAMTEIMKEVDSMRIESGMNKGKYNLEQIIQNYGAKCEEILNSDYPEAATNYHEGYLYGETNGRGFEINWEVSAGLIKTKFGNVSNKIINDILNTLASYGSKLNINDLEVILDKLTEYYGTGNNLINALVNLSGTINTSTNESSLQEVIKALVDRYLDGKEHRAGLLFGIGGGGMAAAQVQDMTKGKIQEKFPNLSDEDIYKIISTLADYGDKLSFDDLDAILNRIAELSQDGKLDGKFILESIIEWYLEHKPKPETPQEEIEEIDNINKTIENTMNIFE